MGTAQKASHLHAGAVLMAGRAILVVGASGSGKSTLCAHLIDRGAHLVADDRVVLEQAHGRLIARPPPRLAGLLELRGRGIVRLPYEPAGVVALVAGIEDKPERMPDRQELSVPLLGVPIARQPVPPDPLRAALLIENALRSLASGEEGPGERSSVPQVGRPVPGQGGRPLAFPGALAKMRGGEQGHI